MERYKIQIAELNGCINMLSGQVWPCGDIDKNAVWSAVKQRDFEAEPWTVYENRSPQSQSENREQWDAAHSSIHIRRIAYFVENGVPTEDNDPIRMGVHDIELGIGLKKQDEPYTLNIAGRHRLAAAIIRGDQEIEITFEGDQDVVKDKLPSAVPLPNKITSTPATETILDFTP